MSILLALSMMLALLPAAALPAEAAWDRTTADTSWYNTTSKSFNIDTPAKLAGLAKIVNGKASGITRDLFDGKTINLTADLDLGKKTGPPSESKMPSTTSSMASPAPLTAKATPSPGCMSPSATSTRWACSAMWMERSETSP